MSLNKEKVIVIGGGFAGLNCIRELAKNKNVEIILIDKHNCYVFQPLLYQVAVATLEPKDIAVAHRHILAKFQNVTCVMGKASRIDTDKKEVCLENGDLYDYDHLIVTAGASHTYFGNDDWEKHAPGLKTIRDALTIREKMLTSFEKAERLDSIKEAQKYLNFVVVGGGPTGVEIAGNIAEIITRTLTKNFRRIDIKRAKIFLVEGLPKLLPPYPDSLSERTKIDLMKLGVTVLTDSRVLNINSEGVQIGERFIHSNNVIWAAGNKVAPIYDSIDAEKDRAGRVVVNSDFSVPNHPEIFILGDGANYKYGKNKQPLFAIASVAIQQGRYLGKTLSKRFSKKVKSKKHKDKPFRYFDKGMLATIGAFKAVGSFKGIKFKGFIAWFIWGVVHIYYLIGFRNRLSVMLEWIIHHISGTRAARVIIHEIDETTPKNKKHH